MKNNSNTSELDSLFKTTSDHKEENKLDMCKGILAAFAWVPLLVTSAASVQLLERRIPDFELNALRFGTAGVIFAIVIFFNKICPIVPKFEIPSVLGFVTFTFCATVSTYTAVTFISLSSFQSIYLSSCIVSGIILFAIFLKEQITLKMVFAAILCCIGVLLVIQPQFIFHDNSGKITEKIGNISEEIFTKNETNATNSEEVTQIKDSNGLLDIFGMGISLLSGLCTSLNILLVKKRSFLHEHMLETLFWSYGICTVLSTIGMAIFEKPTLPEFGINDLYVTLHCTTYVLQWPLYMYAARYISGTTINMIVTTSVVFMLIPQYTVLSTIFPGNRNWIEAVGVFLVLLGCSLRSVAEIGNKSSHE